MDKDPFETYYIDISDDPEELEYAWKTAIGLQQVDNLKPSEYLLDIARKNIAGSISIDEANTLIHNYYEHKEDAASDTAEADIVSGRITKLLSENSFSFSPIFYLQIHKQLFDGILLRAGKIRTHDISKKEWVLDGDTVLYGSSSQLMATLEYDFDKEMNFSYAGKTIDEVIRHIAEFISGIWQIHVFDECNTRTTAAFLIKYLRYLGFKAENDSFAENSCYFRNALVRANYRNVLKGIDRTSAYLELFLRNLLLGEDNELKNRYLHIRWNENNEADEAIQISSTKGLSRKTAGHITKLSASLNNTVFSRKEVMEITGLTATAATTLVKRMAETGVIEAVKGQGKGKYRFIQPS